MAARPDRGVLITSVAVLLTAVLAAASTQGLLLGVVAILASAFLVVTIALGSELTGRLVMTAAFFSAPMYRGIEGLTGGVATPTDLLIVLGTLLLLPTLINRPLQVPGAFVAGFMLVTVCGLIVSGFVDAPIGHLFALVQWLFFLGGLPLILAWWRPSTTVVVQLLWAYLAGHMVSTVWALGEGPLGNDRYDGLTHHTNAFGVAGLICVAIVLFLFHHHKGLRLRVVVLGIGGVAFLSLMLSGSRAALLVAVALLVMIPVVERSAVSGFVFAILGAIGLFSLPLLVSISGEGSALSRLAGDATSQVADSTRSEALQLGLDRFWESPIIGSGLVDVELVHNVFLEVLVGIGVIGLLGYLVMLYVLARPLFSELPLRRLCYVAWAVIGVAPALPGLWDRTAWVPMSVVMLAVLAHSEARLADQPHRRTAVTAP